MADPIKLELKEKDLTPGANTLKELKDFRKDFEVKLTEAKNKKTLEEAKALFPDVTFFYDADERVLQIGDITMQATSEKQWSEWMSKMAADITALNSELAILDFQKKEEVKETTNEALIAMLQRIVDEQKDLKKKLEEFTAKNSPDGSNEDVAKMFELTNKLQGAIVSKDTLLASTVTAATVAALEEQNNYLRKIVEGYEKEGAKFDIKKFREKNQKHISKDLQQFAKQFNVDLSGTIAADKKGTDKNDNQSKEKTYEEMSEAERIAKVQEAMQTLATVQMVSERDPITGRQVNVVNMSTTQISAVQTIQQFGGADAAYEAMGYEPTRLDKRNDRLVEKTQKLMNRGKLDKSLKFAEKANTEFTKQRKVLQKINAFSQNFANERNRASYNKNVANNAMNLAKGPGYAGVTMDVIPYAPLFTNICHNITAIADRGHITMDVIGIGPVQVRSPERYKLAFGDAFNGVAAQYGLDGQYALGGSGNGRGVNWVEKQLTKYTGMNTEQSKGLTNGLLLGGGAFLLFKSAKWLFTGEWKSKKKLHETFWGRLALVGGGLWGLNKISQMGTGHGMVDVLKGLYTGKMEFKDLWKWTYAKYGKNSPEYLAGTYQTYNQAFRNVPYGMLLPYVKEGTNGSVEVTDIDGMINQLKLIASQTTDPNQKAAMLSQVSFLESVKKDPNGKNILNQAFANMGLTYKKMNDNKEANGNDIIDKTTERLKKYQELLNEKSRRLKSDKASQDKYLEYSKTGKPTLEDMIKDGCFEKVTTINGRDVADPFVTIGPDGKEIPVDPDTKMDEALKDVDLPLAKQLFIARMSLVERGIDAHFEVVQGTNQMLLTSYKMKTPIQYDNGGWYIGGPSSGNANERLPIRFDNAENALWVANLTNRLIHLNNGKFSSINKPFSAGGANRDLMVGGSPKMIQRLTDTEAVDSATSKKYGGELFATKIDGYANYLNGIHNKNGESIWNEKGKLGFDSRSTYIENWFTGIVPLPKRKPEDVVKAPDANKDQTPDATKTPDGTNKTPDVAPVVTPDPNKNPDGTNKTPDVTKNPDGTDKTPEQILQEKIDKLVDANDVRGLMEIFRGWSRGKDGGSLSNPSDTYDMPDGFYRARATNYILYGEKGAGNKEFTYNYENRTKGIKKAVTYERQEGRKAPRRIKEEDGKR